jgi:uncharacterized protein (DUF433 family)
MNKRIVSKYDVCGGEVCVKGTRIPVRVILAHLAAGDSEAEILRQFPKLSKGDIKACLKYAASIAS